MFSLVSRTQPPPPGLAVRALTADDTLLFIALSTSPAEQVATLVRLSCLSKAVRAASLTAWRDLCFSRWPSCGSLAGVREPRAWRALALARSAAEVPSLLAQQQHRRFAVQAWKRDDLAPFILYGHMEPLLLLDVSCEDTFIFSGRLGGGDSLLELTDEERDGGIVADDFDEAEEYTDAHQRLHLAPDSDAMPSFPERLLLLHTQSDNDLEKDICLEDSDLDAWDGGSDDDDEVVSSEGAITAELCVIQVNGEIAVLHLGAATRDRNVHDHFRDDPCIYEYGKRRQPSGMLRWARTFEGVSWRPGFDVILNVYCLSESNEEDGDVQAAMERAPRFLSLSSESESDMSAGKEARKEAAREEAAREEAVRKVAADRLERQRRLRETLGALDAERAVVARQLADCSDGPPGRDHHDKDIGDVAAAGTVPSPRVSGSSQHTQVTASDSEPDCRIKPSSEMRLALASLSIGWIPAGNVGAATVRSMRAESAAQDGLRFDEIEIDDEREMSDGEEHAVQEVEAAYFWQQLDARMPWL